MMTIEELKNKVKNNLPAVSKGFNLCFGYRSDHPNTIGIFEENDVYYIYDVSPNGEYSVRDHGTEDEMARIFYKMLCKMENFVFINKVESM